MNDCQQLQSLLNGHTGSETIYKHSLVRSFCYTQGVRDFAREAGGGAYWMLDILATEALVRKLILGMGFGLVTLEVDAFKAALLEVREDSGKPAAYSRRISYTDCPICPSSDGWKFYIEPTMSGEDLVLLCMLPQER